MADDHNPDVDSEEISFTPEERKEWEAAEREAQVKLLEDLRNKNNQSEPVVVFECRMCSGGEYDWRRGRGYYSCRMCSAVFEDPVKFSNR